MKKPLLSLLLIFSVLFCHSQEKKTIESYIFAIQKDQYVSSVFTPSFNNMGHGKTRYYFLDKDFKTISETENLKNKGYSERNNLYQENDNAIYSVELLKSIYHLYKAYCKGKDAYFTVRVITADKGIIEKEFPVSKVFSAIGKTKTDPNSEAFYLNNGHVFGLISYKENSKSDNLNYLLFDLDTKTNKIKKTILDITSSKVGNFQNYWEVVGLENDKIYLAKRVTEKDDIAIELCSINCLDILTKPEIIKINFKLPEETLSIPSTYGDPVFDDRITKADRVIKGQYDGPDYVVGHNAHLKLKIVNGSLFAFSILAESDVKKGIFFKKFDLKGNLIQEYFSTKDDTKKIEALFNTFGYSKMRVNITELNHVVNITFGYNKLYRVDVKNGKAINISTLGFGYSYEKGVKLTKNVFSLLDYSDVIIKNQELLSKYSVETSDFYNGNLPTIFEDDTNLYIADSQRKKEIISIYKK